MIISTSKYIKKEELSTTDPLALTISGYAQENVGTEEKQDLKWVLRFEEIELGLPLNKTRIEQMRDITGSPDADHWVGKVIGLVHDPNVKFGGKKVGGVSVVKV